MAAVFRPADLSLAVALDPVGFFARVRGVPGDFGLSVFGLASARPAGADSVFVAAVVACSAVVVSAVA